MSEKSSWGLEEGDELVPGRTVQKNLGGGTRFEVYLVADDHLMTTVVAKVLRPDRAERASAREALAREQAALADLAHPHIVRAFGADVESDRPHILLEHLEGPTLARLVRKHGPLIFEQAIPLAIALGSAIHYMAEEGWVHLDVKPDNVVVGISGTLVDMSAARTLDLAAKLDEPVGTRRAMAPEQCEPKRRGPVGPPADVWGLGVTIYKALSGVWPFDSDDVEYPQLMERPAPMPKKVPPQVAEPVLACLVPNPADRPTAQEAIMSFEHLIGAIPRRPRLRRGRPRMS